ncbi:MAG: ABC transporter ATP-binding protein [Anaerolineaceae bacterium]
MSESVILQLKDVQKSFDGHKALDNVSFELCSNEIHGLLGGNGAGKTTLMNILYGLYRMDAGEIFLHDKKIEISSPKNAIEHRIGMVHQHFLQIGNYTVLENIVLGTDIKNSLTLNLKEEEKKINDLSKRFGLDVDLNTMIEEFPMGIRQKVEILKALYRGVEILILDEPTTNLTPQEVDALFKSLRVMVNEGMSIVFITHKLREVLSVCDRISVLRDGKNVLSLKKDEANEEQFVRGMVGESMDVQKSIIFSKGKRGAEADIIGETPVLKMENVRVLNADGIARCDNVSLTIHEREIFGVAGVAGNGQRELAETLLGLQKVESGSIELEGQSLIGVRTSEILKKGLAYIPEDRLHDGFLPKANVAQNLILGFHKQEPYSKRGFINWKIVHESALDLINTYNIKTSGPDAPGGNLSGGNIQRVMIARAFSQPAKLMVMQNPTRGLDIPSMDFVYSKLLDRKKTGMATLLISEDLDELLLLCDKIAVLYRGEIVGVLNRDKFEKYELGRMMSGVKTVA